ncbi:hypothetical protein ACGRHY_30155 [Streptomyces sp. HK10]|uniref:hypothetical protein n=1 Tax=Streptomyces sp. HK10 TaxID=3373255 RepID=UPI00374898CF
MLPALDPETCNTVAGWLDDLVVAGVVVRDLREGRPHVVTLGPQGNRRWWVIHPAAPTPCHGLMERQGDNADTLLHTRLDHVGGTGPTETDTVWHLVRAVASAPPSRPARPGGHSLPHETAER